MIFLLLEFQSKPESMILRLFEYLSRIYKKQYIELKSLFPVIPIVIYNGKEKRLPLELLVSLKNYKIQILKYLLY